MKLYLLVCVDLIKGRSVVGSNAFMNNIAHHMHYQNGGCVDVGQFQPGCWQYDQDEDLSMFKATTDFWSQPPSSQSPPGVFEKRTLIPKVQLIEDHTFI